MAETHQWLIQWLRDAHAMEEQAETMLSGQIERLDSYPELRQRIKTHLDETRQQAKRLEDCLKQLGEETSTLKDASGKLTAMAQALGGLVAGDEVLKGSLAGYTFEQMEIGTYTVLIAAAESVGEGQIARVCEQNLREEEAMAEWLRNHLGPTTEKFLFRDEMGSEAAKR